MRKLGTAALVAAVVLAGSLVACRTPAPTTANTGEKTDHGVTKEPCPDAVDKAKGCIYLGVISDLTVGPFAPLGKPVTDAQKAFWARVNKSGGIAGKYEVDVTKYVRDNKYTAQTHNEVYQEIKGSVLALAQTLGSPTTAGDPGGPQGHRHRRGARRRGPRRGTSRTSSSRPARATAWSP